MLHLKTFVYLYIPSSLQKDFSYRKKIPMDWNFFRYGILNILEKLLVAQLKVKKSKVISKLGFLYFCVQRETLSIQVNFFLQQQYIIKLGAELLSVCDRPIIIGLVVVLPLYHYHYNRPELWTICPCFNQCSLKPAAIIRWFLNSNGAPM